MIDWARVAELRREVGADDFGEIVEIFLEEVETGIDKLRGPVLPEGLEDLFHFLKGSALNLGFDRFSVLCRSGEIAMARGDRAGLDLSATISAFDRSREEFLAGLPALLDGARSGTPQGPGHS
ncbi:Hpt domain-containing protein [Roseovarius sp. SCSIO 43702]|uniref:Hpt domain-containing protein n=1 Tax=Roseovarius sp. SCSIO 43702 TaxID=2823043 RepID=UPI001C732EEB|nr:Hpt domain-containing protein [Roseovarius sp. SCSIO 43702]QYX58454.1 Hpt domain-containing protein [Roseovarius sp. SCSIO 43702]